MTLSRKFIEAIAIEKDDVKLIQKCVSITDEHMIKFAEWLFKQPKYKVKTNNFNLLLTEYKKQNNL